MKNSTTGYPGAGGLEEEMAGPEWRPWPEPEAQKTHFTRLAGRKSCMGDRFLYSDGTDLFEKFTAEFSASAPVVYRNLPPMGPEMLYTTGAGRGVKVSVAIFPSSSGGV